MKKKNVVFTIIVAILILAVVLIKFLPNMLNGESYDNLVIYKNGNMVNITEEQKETLTNYLKKEPLKKVEGITPNISKTYTITYDTKEISFDSDTYCYFKNNYTLENYYSSITPELRNYIINITN